MARPDCPRCGSDLVAVAVSDSPSEWVEELRGGSARAHPVTLAEATWLCRACGHRWQPPREAEHLASLERATPEQGGELLVPGNLEQGGLAPEDLLQAALDEAALKHADLEPGDVEPGDMEPGDLEPEDLDPGDADRTPPPIRQFVELLNLGPERSFVAAGSEPLLKELPDPRRRRSVVGVVLTLASLAVVVVLALQAPRSSPLSDLREPSDVPATAEGSAPVSPSPSVAPERRGLRAVLDVEQACWVRVVADGEFVEEVTLQPGDAPAYRAKRDLELRLGNAGGVTLRVNGDPTETGPSGDVMTITLSWRQGEVHVERVTLS